MSDKKKYHSQSREQKKQAKFLRQARQVGARQCGNGHGLVGPNVAGSDGVCMAKGCGSTEEYMTQPLNTFIDWAQVYQALQGKPLFRPLTHAEVLCALTTVMRRNDVGRVKGHQILVDMMDVEPADLTYEYVDYLYSKWMRRNNVRPMTIEQAILAVADEYDPAADAA